MGGRTPLSTMPTARAIVPGTSIGSSTGSNGTKKVPSGKSVPAAWASSIANRVLPIPPGPVIVMSRAVRSRLPAAVSSGSRPTNDVTGLGRLFGRASIVRRTGKSVMRPSTSSWLSRSGSGKSRRRNAPRSRHATPLGRASPTMPRVAAETTTWPPWPAFAIRAARLMSMPT